jgi:chromate transporter
MYPRQWGPSQRLCPHFLHKGEKNCKDRQRGARHNGAMSTSPAPAPARPQPRSPTDLFLSFTWLALQGFGGVLAVVQRELVEKKRWLTTEEFVEDWAVAQIMPGPNVVNLSIMIGDRHFGLRGAMAALAGMLCMPLLGVLALALVYAQYAQYPQVVGALRGMGAVAAGLITAAGLRLLPALRRHALGIPLCAVLAVACFILVAWLHLPLVYVLPSLGGLACLLTYRKLKP